MDHFLRDVVKVSRQDMFFMLIFQVPTVIRFIWSLIFTFSTLVDHFVRDVVRVTR